ncbi:MAG: N-acetyltransferase family protein [Pseudomonadota bacterium]
MTPEQGIEIRPALKSDAAQIQTLWNQVISETTHTFTTQAKSVGAIETLIETMVPGRRVVCALQGAIETRVLLGFALSGEFRGGPGYSATVEHSIYLDPKAQGQGLGRRLLDVLFAKLAEDGITASIAGISGENHGAIAFHERMGLAHVGRLPQVGQKWGRKIDLVLMQKTL